MNDNQFPWSLWTEVLPGLWQGGTDDYDHITGSQRGRSAIGVLPQRPTKNEFDSVYTMYAFANPAGFKMKEVRTPFMDGDMSDIDVERDLWLPVSEAHADWKAGRRVLIRCQAGLNRSGLVMALVLVREGYSPEEAVALIRETRGEDALCNYRFVRWLTNEANLGFWRAKAAA